MTESDRRAQVELSKLLSYVLRHGAAKMSLSMSNDGYVFVDDIMKLREFQRKRATIETITQIVDLDEKKRFEMKKYHKNGMERWFIRAAQGHSLTDLDPKAMFTVITDPVKYPACVHGTYEKNWPSIREYGLKTMSRQYVHFAVGYPNDGDVISGMRRSCDIFIELDLIKATKDGMVFYLSSNNVILTEGFNGIVPTKYFKLIKNRNGDIFHV